MRHILTSVVFFLLVSMFFSHCTNHSGTKTAALKEYNDLVKLFKKWRAFERPPSKEGAPDYSEVTFSERMVVFKALRQELMNMDTTGWSIPQKVDWHIVWAEMNGFEFNQRILRPWERDPAFYKTIWTERSDVPAHEGPSHHALIELWKYTFPLNTEERKKLIDELKVIPPLNKQAMTNLKGNARDIWITGIRDIQNQSEDLKEISKNEGVLKDTNLMNHIQLAVSSTDSLTEWLIKESSKKTGPSGIGKEQYTWFLRNVLLVPMNWEQEAMLLQRELARAWSSLKLEEHHNRDLPPLQEAVDSASFAKLAESAVEDIIHFLEKKEIVTVKDYFLPALSAHKGSFIPKERRHFFWIASHYDPRPLYSHFYHWFELAQMDLEPHTSEIRRSPLLYNIFSSHNEGMATAVEEIFMQAGMYDRNPRGREIVYIMLAQRAARGLGSLYAHSNEMTMEQAGGIHTNFTPRGWMKTEKVLQQFEQQLFLRQPGYGTSYISGKYLIDEMIAEAARQNENDEKPFELKKVMDGFNASGCIPVSLIQWELTGNRNAIAEITETYKPIK